MAACQRWIVLAAVIFVFTLLQQTEEVKGWKKSLNNKLNKYIKRIAAIEDCKRKFIQFKREFKLNDILSARLITLSFPKTKTVPNSNLPQTMYL